MIRVASIAILAVLLSACAGSKVQYGDATEVETVTVDFGSTDLQGIAAKMVDSLLSFPPMVEVLRDKRPVIFIDTIRNKTSEHIDTENITDKISTKMIKSGKFRFVDMSKVEVVKKQFDFQLSSGMVDPSKAVAFGRQIGAEYMLYGNLSSIVKRTKSVQDTYYIFTLKLMHLESGIIEWQDEKEIRKQRNKKMFGM